MSILCDKCTHKNVCTYAKDFKHIINRIDKVGIMTSEITGELKHLDDFKWFSYSPHCKHYEYKNTITNK